MRRGVNQMPAWAAFCLGSWFVLGTTGLAAAQAADCGCGQTLRCYEDQGYTVARVRLETLFEKNVPLSLLFKVQQLVASGFAQIKPQLVLQEGQPFTVADYNRGQADFINAFNRLAPSVRFRFVYEEPSLEACDPQALTVDIVHRLFVADGPSFLTSRFEDQRDKVSRGVLVPIPNSDRHKILPQPYVQYNRSRGVVGGTGISFKADSGLFDKVTLDASGSETSATADFGVSGSREIDHPVINHVEWKAGYHYSNIPADRIRFREASGGAQFAVGTQPLGPFGTALRFGAALTGGSRDTDVTGVANLSADLLNAPYTAAKFYAGSTMNWARQAWTTSYGLELGRAGSERRFDYLKHVVDAVYSVRMLPREHLPLRLDVQFNAGRVTSATGLIPISERFFGGNTETSFIKDDSWHLNSMPVIRSFPQYQLGVVGSAMPIGGTNFASTNLTMAQTVWHRAAVPDEIARSEDLRIQLGNEITVNRLYAVGSHLSVSPAFGDLLKQVDELDSTLTALKATLEGIVAGLPPASQSTVNDLFFGPDDDSGFVPLPDALDAIAAVKQQKPRAGSEISTLIGQLTTVVTDQPDLPFKSYVTLLLDKIVLARTALDALRVPSDALAAFQPKLAALQSAVVRQIALVNNSGNYDPADIRRVADAVSQIPPLLDDLRRQRDQLPPAGGSEDAAYALARDSFVRYLDLTTDIVNATLENSINTWNAEQLAIGYGGVSPALLAGLANSIQQLQAPLRAKGGEQQARELQDLAQMLPAAQTRVAAALKPAKVPEVVRLANRDIAYTVRVLDVILNELNLVAVSPVLMFDAARIGIQQTTDPGQAHYGIGAGVRFSLVTLDLSLGYSWNLNRRAEEGHGAFVFSMTISDLFR